MRKKTSCMWITNSFLALAALGLSLSLVLTVHAQSTTDGAIAGTVYDQTGAVVPGATILIHNNGTNLEQTLATDASGFYRAIKLQPAVFTVTITAAGFQTFKAEEVVVTVGSVTDVSAHLKVGTNAQTVTVTGVAPQINTNSADFASTLNQNAISNLPIQRPRWSNFALLTPGVVNDSNGFGLLSFRGISTLLNNNTIDGADNNQAFFSEERGRTRISYSSSEVSIQEFQVNTSNYSSEYGRAAGGVVNTVTKSGTNQFHGELFYKNRENGWASRNPFATLTEQTSPGVFTTLPLKPKDYWDMWGAGIGGPIIKDKLFFFAAYDGFFRNFPGNAVPSSPSVFFATPLTPSALAGYGGACSNGSATGVSAASLKSAGVPNSTNVYNSTNGTCGIAQVVGGSYATGYTDFINGLAGLNSMLGSNARTGKQDIFFPKIDWQVNSRNRASFEVNRMRWASPYGVQTQVTNSYSNGAAFGNDYVKDTWGVGKFDSFFSPTVSNEARYQIGRDFEYESTPPPDAYEVNELQKTSTSSATYPSWTNYNNPFGLPTYVTLTNGFNFGAPYYDTRISYPNELRNQIADTVTWTHGNQTFKFGGDFSHVSDKILDIYQQNGQFGYSNVWSYFEDLYATPCATGNTSVPCGTHYSSFAQGFGPLGYTIATDDVALFAQDDYKVLPRLSITLGLRWEYEHLPAPLYPNPAVPATTQLPDYKKNFGPRVGVAWDVTGDGKTAIRGGFGIYYGRITNGIIYSVLTQTGLVQNGALTGQPSYSFSSAAAGGPYFPQVLSAAPTATAAPAIMYFNPSYHSPEIDMADFAFERDLGWNTVFSVSYLGTFGHMLPQYTDDNIAAGTNAAGAGSTLTYKVATGGPLAAPTLSTTFYGYRPNTHYAQMIDIFGVNSTYNALVVQATHRLSSSLTFNANYTWSHGLDFNPSTSTTLTASSGFNMFAPNNVSLDYGNSNFNVPNRIVISIVGRSPWHTKGALSYLADGWQLSPIFQAQTGLPYSVGTSGSAPGVLGNGGGINGADGAFRLGATSRNAYQQPGLQNLDLRISKTIAIKDTVNLELLGEAFNLFNHFNVTGVGTTGYIVSKSGSITDTTGATQTCTSSAACLSYSTSFGLPSSANSNFAYSTRQIQIGLRLKF